MLGARYAGFILLLLCNFAKNVEADVLGYSEPHFGVRKLSSY